MIGVEPEIIQCAIANGIGVLVLRKGLSVPGYGIGSLSYSPRSAAIALVIKGAVVCPTGLLRRRVEAYVSYVSAVPNRDAKGLDSSVQVLVI